MVPGLRPDSHAAAHALLIFCASNTCPACRGQPVKAAQPLRLNHRAHRLTLRIQGHKPLSKLFLSCGDPCARLFERLGQRFHIGASLRQRSFLLICPFQALQLFVFQPFDLVRRKLDLMLHCLSLRRCLHHIELRPKTRRLLPMVPDLPFELCAQRLLTAQRCRSIGRPLLGRAKLCLRIAHLAGQCACRFGNACAVQFYRLKLYKVFNQLSHPCNEVYGIRRQIKKSFRWPHARCPIFRLYFKERCTNPIRCIYSKMADGIRETVKDEQNKDMRAARPSFWRRHRWLKWTLSIVLAVLVALAITVTVIMHRAEPLLRAYIVQALEDHFHSRVELDGFHVSVASGLWAEGRGLRIWPPAEVHGVSVPAPIPDAPIISLDEFRFHAPLRYSPNTPVHISVVQLKGLIVNIPPRSRFAHVQSAQPSAPQSSEKSAVKKALLNFVLDSIVCTSAQLNIETSKPGKLPLNFVISSLKLTHIKAGGTMDFDAQLINARPVGTIFTTGNFGPWTVDDPGNSPVSGQYKFQHANLGDFKGISGTLYSTGKYRGTLRNLIVDGVTDTPNFQLTHFGSPQPLHTQFHALVDATNGDTHLDPVHATLGQSQFTVRGDIVRVPVSDAGSKPSPSGQSAAPPHMKGHEISLMVNVPGGRMEDFLRLVSSSGTPLLTGTLTMKTSLDIPPGPDPVHQRMKLNGSFTLNDAQFTDEKIQQRIGELSLRGQGQPGQAKKDEATAAVVSTMQSGFQMANGIITLPDLRYSVPGADISMTGSYGIEGGTLNFTGKARMQATVSQMVGGWKGFLLKPADRFFRKDGAGTEVPIHIKGTREHPDFGVDIKGVKSTSPQRSDQPH